MAKKILVAGIGNRLMGDDGFGSFLAEKLSKENIDDDVDVIDYGLGIIKLLHDVEDYKALIILDAVKRGGEPGEIIVEEIRLENIVDIDWEDSSKLFSTSYHEADIETFLALGKKLGILPNKVFLVGIIPREIRPKIGLSKEVESKLDEARIRILEIIKRLKKSFDMVF